MSFAVQHASLETIEPILMQSTVKSGQLPHHAIEREKDVITVLDMLVSRREHLSTLYNIRQTCAPRTMITLRDWVHHSIGLLS